jgi:RNA polymerase sigma-70 factor, ECF subfamily
LKAEIKNISFEKLYKEYSSDIFRYAFSILRNYEDSRDIVQEVFAKHFENEASFKGNCTYKTWLFVIARNLCFSSLKSRDYKTGRIDNYNPEKTYANTFDINISVRDALMKLPVDLSELLYLKEYEGYSYSEIAAITGLSVDNVGVKLFRAKKLLRKHLKGLL